MNIKQKAHKKALTELIEVITIASLASVVADVGWCIYEIYNYGLHVPLLIVLIILFTSAIVITKALYKYHMKQVKEFLHEHLLLKLKRTKRRNG